MGYADGGGLNVWRQVTRMEAILQALTYPEIGKMMFRDAQWNPDPSVAAGDIRYLIQAGRRLHHRLPRPGDEHRRRDPGGQGRRDPVLDVLGRLGRAPRPGGRARPGRGLPDRRRRGPLRARQELRRGHQRRRRLGQGRPHGRHAGQRPVARAGSSATWRRSNAVDQDARSGRHLLVERRRAADGPRGGCPPNPDIKGYAYEYADGLNTALQAYKDLGIPRGDPHGGPAHRRADAVLHWKKMNDPDYPHLVLGRRQLPVPGRGDRVDDVR